MREREDEGTYTHSPLETEHSHSDNSNTLEFVGGKKKKKRTNLKIKSISTPAHFLSLSLSIQNGLTRAYVSGEVTMLCIDRQDDNDDERKSILSCVRLRPLNQGLWSCLRPCANRGPQSRGGAMGLASFS